MSSQIYRPVNRSTNDIRLLVLHSAQDRTAHIVCDLIHASLDLDIDYVALSYAWIHTGSTKEVTVDGHPFEVTENLHAALVELRNRLNGERGRFWVDAICINQSDIPERNTEVLRMFQIYQRATYVLIWLGPATADSDLAIRHISALSSGAARSQRISWRLLKYVAYAITVFLCCVGFVFRKPSNAVKVLIFHFFPRWTPSLYLFGLVNSTIWTALMAIVARYCWSGDNGFKSVHHWILIVDIVISITSGSASGFMYWWMHLWRNQVFEAPGVQLPSTALTEALRKFFRRDWFSRTWVIQECGAAKDAFILCGSQCLQWDVLMDGLCMMEFLVISCTEKHAFADLAYIRVLQLGKVRDIESLPAKLARQQSSLLYLINEFSSHDSADLKDKVYGLLGLSLEGQCNLLQLAQDKFQLLPDYNKSVIQVYTETARFIIESSRNLHIFNTCLYKGSIQGLPSWVPGWTVKQSRDVGGLDYWQSPFYIESDEATSKTPVATF